MLTNAERECLAAPEGYTLPYGITWQDVAESRAHYGHASIMLPVAVVPGSCIAWGVPFIDGKPVRHRLAEFT